MSFIQQVRDVFRKANRATEPRPSDEPIISPVILPPDAMRLEEWRKIPNLVVEAKRLRANPTFSAMLAVMRNDTPANYHLPARGVQPSDAILHLGEIQGYNRALNMIEAFSQPPVGTKSLSAAFQEEEVVVDEGPIPFAPVAVTPVASKIHGYVKPKE